MVKTATQTQPDPAIVEDNARLASVPITDDVVEYTIACALALSPPDMRADIRQRFAEQTSKQVRRVFGRDRVYIGVRAGEGNSARNAAIKRDYLAGEHIPLLERRYGLKRSRLWEIIKS